MSFLFQRVVAFLLIRTFKNVFSAAERSDIAENHSSGNKPELKDLLKILRKGIEIRSADSRISLSEILLRPVALDLDNLFRREKTLLLLIGLNMNLLLLLTMQTA